MGYWASVQHEGALACVYSDKDCSLASGTWVLADFTLSAFIAAAVAAFYTVQTYLLETKKMLGQRLCAEKDHHECPDVTLYVTNVSRARGHQPVGFKDAEFTREDHAFLNLGRVPLVDVAVHYEISFKDSAKSKIAEKLAVGCIQVDGEAHVTVFFRKGLPRPKLRWEPKAYELDVRNLDFNPGKSYTTAAESVGTLKSNP